MSGTLSNLSGTAVLARCISNAAKFREGGLSSHPVSRPATAVSAPMDGMEAEKENMTPAEAKEEKQRQKDVQAADDRARFAKLRALTKTLKLKGLGLKLRGKQFN